MATTGSLKVAWQFADFTTKTTTIEPLDATEASTVSTIKTRLQTVKANMASNGFGDGLVSTNGASCTGISSAAFTEATSTNIYNADTYSE